jgi:hypothetical protein
MSANPVEPTSANLQQVLNQVLEFFAYALAVPRSEAGELALSVRAALPEGRGWLVLRCTPGLARRLAEDSTGGEADELARDAFAELCNLSASHLVSLLWGNHHSAFTPFVPAEGVPEGERRSLALMDVDGEPLEASYWRAA